jgi:hypothetical protein
MPSRERKKSSAALLMALLKLKPACHSGKGMPQLLNREFEQLYFKLK